MAVPENLGSTTLLSLRHVQIVPRLGDSNSGNGCQRFADAIELAVVAELALSIPRHHSAMAGLDAALDVTVIVMAFRLVKAIKESQKLDKIGVRGWRSQNPQRSQRDKSGTGCNP